MNYARTKQPGNGTACGCASARLEGSILLNANLGAPGILIRQSLMAIIAAVGLVTFALGGAACGQPPPRIDSDRAGQLLVAPTNDTCAKPQASLLPSARPKEAEPNDSARPEVARTVLPNGGEPVRRQPEARDAEPTDRSNGTGYLLLRNGNVLQGQVQSCDGGYKVAVPGGEIFVAERDVELRASSLRECYRRKLAAVPPGDAQSRLELALWCLRYQLLEEAREGLAAARLLDASHPMIPLVARRLGVATAGPMPRSGTSPLPDRGPSLEQLERLVRGMPPGTVEKFTQVVQPLLIHRCGTSQCHGQASRSRFRLLAFSGLQRPTRVATQRNLHAVLEQLDLENPAESPLLRAAIEPHGTCQQPPFLSTAVDQYREIVDWVAALAAGKQGGSAVSASGSEQPAFGSFPPETITDGTGYLAPLGQAGSVPPGVTPAAQRLAEIARGPHPLDSRGAGHLPTGRETPSSQLPGLGNGHPTLTPSFQKWWPDRGFSLPDPREDKASSPNTVNDPFDPELFNRRYWSPTNSGVGPSASPVQVGSPP